jgi:hypothetical protein
MVMRLPKRTVPVIRKASTAQVAGQIEPAGIFDVVKKVWNKVKRPAKTIACSACPFIPHPVAKAACMAACAL